MSYFSLTWKSSKSEDKKLRKRPFTLDIGKGTHPSEKHKSIPKRKSDTPKRLSPMKELKVGDKPKRGKMRTRSPLQNHRMKKTSPLLRSPAMSEGYSAESWEQAAGEVSKVTSDDSSGGICAEKSLSNQASPRKSKKNRENMRRKSSPRSPTGRSRRRSGSAEDKPSSLPGSLPRRRSSTQMKSLDVDDGQRYLSSSRLSPYR